MNQTTSTSNNNAHPNRTIGVFGGTFDPIHFGHLRTAFELMQAVNLDEVRFIPCGDPPHGKRTVATADQRFDMVELAVEAQAGFVADDREIIRGGASYTVDTLESLRTEFPDASLCLILGMDAFLGLPSWHQWRRLLNLANIIVAHRPGWRKPTDGRLQEILRDQGTAFPGELHWHHAGRIYIHAVTQLEIASSRIRDLIQSGYDARFLLPDKVNQKILDIACYHQRDDSEE
ncbi:MAG: nicotinate-nucleotide adenylyltransferase [Gammaproteobacteria bacterium]|nr:nicotinate-nucleotide adenylyltransferase [Gammaproteobacteria bacterium]